MKIIDTHCHYNLEPLFSGKKSHFRIKDEDKLLTMSWQDHWKTAQNKGVAGGVVVGADIVSSLKALEITKSQPQLIAAIGIHPHEAETHSLVEYEKFLTDILPNNKVKAIGEIGLDYFKLTKNTVQFLRTRQAQHNLFTLQIEIAKKHNLPIIVHVRDDGMDAYWETLEIIKKNHDQNLKFVLHCVSGPERYVQEALDLGAYLGFDGNITYKSTENLKNILRSTPIDKILLETDAPYLPPQNYRGQVCEPWMITETGKYLADNFSLKLDLIFENSKKFFSYQF